VKPFDKNMLFDVRVYEVGKRYVKCILNGYVEQVMSSPFAELIRIYEFVCPEWRIIAVLQESMSLANAKKAALFFDY